MAQDGGDSPKMTYARMPGAVRHVNDLNSAASVKLDLVEVDVHILRDPRLSLYIQSMREDEKRDIVKIDKELQRLQERQSELQGNSTRSLTADDLVGMFLELGTIGENRESLKKERGSIVAAIEDRVRSSKRSQAVETKEMVDIPTEFSGYLAWLFAKKEKDDASRDAANHSDSTALMNALASGGLYDTKIQSAYRAAHLTPEIVAAFESAFGSTYEEALHFRNTRAADIRTAVVFAFAEAERARVRGPLERLGLPQREVGVDAISYTELHDFLKQEPACTMCILYVLNSLKRPGSSLIRILPSSLRGMITNLKMSEKIFTNKNSVIFKPVQRRVAIDSTESLYDILARARAYYIHERAKHGLGKEKDINTKIAKELSAYMLDMYT